MLPAQQAVDYSIRPRNGTAFEFGGMGDEDPLILPNGYYDPVFVGSSSTEVEKRKKREQVAQASRVAREKRKREVVVLVEENKRLLNERHLFLGKIQDLQLKVENLRQQGSFDLELENELLKSQLEDHKKFVQGFMRLASGIPSDTLSRRAVYSQGAEFALNHALSLVSHSVQEKWRTAEVPSHVQQMVPSLRVCYQYVDDYGIGGRKRLNLRLDMALPDVDLQVASELYWNVWTDPVYQSSVYGLLDKPCEFRPLVKDNLDDADDDSKLISAAYYREKYQPPVKDKDWVFVSTKQRQQMAKSTLQLDGNKKAKVNKHIGTVSCDVLARSTTQHLQAPDNNETHRITSLLVEGCVLWEETNCTHLLTVLSLPDDFKMRVLSGFNSILEPNGVLTLSFCQYLTSFLDHAKTPVI